MKRKKLKLAECAPGWKDAALILIALVMLIALIQTWVEERVDISEAETRYATWDLERAEISETNLASMEKEVDKIQAHQFIITEPKQSVEIYPEENKTGEFTKQKIQSHKLLSFTQNETINGDLFLQDNVNSNAEERAILSSDRLVHGRPLSDRTQMLYDELHGLNPHFKGWLELPYWNISYPIFVNSKDAMAYVHMNYLGEPSRFGEVHYQGVPGESEQLIIFGHTLTDGRGLGGIDTLPGQEWQALPAEAKVVWLDLYATGQRYQFELVQAEYRSNKDTSWAVTDFGEGPYWKHFWQSHLRLDQEPKMVLTIATCYRAYLSKRSVVYAIPVCG